MGLPSHCSRFVVAMICCYSPPPPSLTLSLCYHRVCVGKCQQFAKLEINEMQL